MKKTLLLLTILLAYCLSGHTQLPSQTKTATNLNNLGQFREVYGDQNFPRATAEDVAVDDDIYASSSRLNSVKDSTSSLTSRSISTLALQGFGFTIPSNATIENISVRVKRFKKGRATVGDFIFSVIQRFEQSATQPSRYGVHWTHQDNYPGKIYPDTETEYFFNQAGSGNNGGFNHDQPYQWTPEMVNNVTFGVSIQNYAPIGRGGVVVYYDMVEIIVEYSESIANASHLESESRTILKKPIVYPNPFITGTTIQFTAAESGNAVVDLYNVAGIKIANIFSGKVEQKQVYTATTKGTLLSTGVYIYRIRNGKYNYTGRMLKLN